MAATTRIEWTEQTWNPTTGCTKVSPGCKHCYAETLAKRLCAMGAPGYENGFELSLMENRLKQPLSRRKPTLYFVNSMSDLFHEAVPEAFLQKIFTVIEQTPHHTYQILTKRAEHMRLFFSQHPVPNNVWLGVSVEDRRYGVPRMDILRSIDARVRFISAEPLLEDLGRVNLSGLHWLIVGGESGPAARPMQAAWVENLQRQCRAQGTAFFFKQWGAFGADGQRRSKHANGRLFQGQQWDERPVIMR